MNNKFLGVIDNPNQQLPVASNGDTIVVKSKYKNTYEILIWDFDPTYNKENWIFAGEVPSKEEASSVASSYVTEKVEKLKGGLADNMTIKDIADKHGVSINTIRSELEKGKDVEAEHTTDDDLAKEIARDHEAEEPKYYTKLAAAGLEENLRDIFETGQIWEEQAEEFDELEILDERKFEKVKMARNMLAKLGHSKAYARNEKGKYILRSKDIRKMMRKLGYNFDSLKGRWILEPTKKKKKTDEPKPIDISPTPIAPEEEKPIDEKNVVLWVGSAKPWHRGHDSIIQDIIENLESHEARRVFIMLIKNTEQEDEQGVMDFDLQRNIIRSIYSEDQVRVCSAPSPTNSIVDILATASKHNVIIKGWVAKGEKLDAYEHQYLEFQKGDHKAEFEQKTSPGKEYPVNSDIAFIKSEENIEDSSEMNNDIAKEQSKSLSFDEWFTNVAPEVAHDKKQAKILYHEAYTTLKNESIAETFYESSKKLRMSFNQIFFG